MHESDDLGYSTADLDQWLRSGFTEPPPLADDFEQRLMQQLGRRSVAWLGRHRLYLVMSLYWMATVSISAWLLWSKMPATGLPQPEMTVLIVSAMAVILVPLWLMLRSVKARLGELFLATLR